MSCWAPTPATRSPSPGPAPPAAPPPAPGSPAGSPAKPPRRTRATRRSRRWSAATSTATLLARLVTDLLAGDLANLVTSTDPVPVPGPRCECDEHPPAPRAPIPGALPTATAASRASQPITTAPPRQRRRHRPARRHPGPVPPGLTGAAAPGTTAPGTGTGSSPLTPGGLARLQDTLLRYAVSLLSGPDRPRRLPADPAHRRVLPRTQPAPGPRPAHRASPAPPAPRRHQARPALLASPAAPRRPSAARCTM